MGTGASSVSFSGSESQIKVYDCNRAILATINYGLVDVNVTILKTYSSRVQVYDAKGSLIGYVAASDPENNFYLSGSVLGGKIVQATQTNPSSSWNIKLGLSDIGRETAITDPRVISAIMAPIFFKQQSVDWCTNTVFFIVPSVAGAVIIFLVVFCFCCNRSSSEHKQLEEVFVEKKKKKSRDSSKYDRV